DDHDHDEHGEEEELPIRVDMRQRRVDLRAEALPMAGAFQKIEVRMTGTDYEHVELEGPDVGTTFSNDYLETRVEMFQRERGRSRGSVGLQYSDRDLAAIGEEAFVPPTQSQGWALFTSQEIEAGPVRWQFGARFEQLDHNPVSSRDTSHDGVSASAGLVWDAGSDWTLGVSVARSARLPAAEELHSDGLHVATLSYEVGDPNLENEVGTGFDVSLRKTEGLLTGELTLFSQSFSDFIYQRFTGEEEDGFAVLRYTQADASTEGAELRLRLELLDRNDHHLHIQAIADTVNAELDAGGNLPRIPPMSFGAGLHYHGHHWRAAVEGRWLDDQNDVAELETPTEGYTLVNAHVGRRFILGNQILDVLLRGRNLTDEEARVHTSFLKNFRPLPGRDVTLSARFWF
ncbi:MAG: TonB-dependent receptor, partial [Holophagales bacterium]|nr:TonB-dependent receptor [Holophagales bacterium]